ncbi:hypothetical protein [Variovorax sp.]|jgi:hypothetical protein|uniref:hypothetical protein n=1 Tax=Variovorax sp. TaxID=1871043 RepID=UPI004037BF4A
MPLLAAFIGSMASGLATLLATQFAYTTALKIAAYTTWITVAAVFFASVFVCCSSLYSLMASSLSVGGGANNWVHMAWVGLGMFIPGNASAVISCIASVWIGTSIWRIQRVGIENFSK